MYVCIHVCVETIYTCVLSIIHNICAYNYIYDYVQNMYICVIFLKNWSMFNWKSEQIFLFIPYIRVT